MQQNSQRPVSTDGGMWYPQAGEFMKVKHPLYSSFEESIIEMAMQYIMDELNVLIIIFPAVKRIVS